MTFPRRRPLPHTPPAWVPAGSPFFLTVCAADRTCAPLLASGVPGSLLAGVRRYHEAGRWQVSLVLVMPDHVHAVVSVPPGEALLKMIVAWKAFSTRQHGVHWQRGFFDHRLRSADERERKLEYIRQNPVRAGLVTAPDEWPWQWQPAGETTLPPW